MPKRIMLEGAALCSPFFQGQLDYLCGLYAAVNALALVIAPIRPLQRAEARELIRLGTEHLQRRNELGDTLNFGMEIKRQVGATMHMFKHAPKVTGIAVTATTPFRGRGCLSPTLAALEKKLASGSALIVFLANTLDHYTVISGMTRHRVMLFDSDGNSWIDRRGVGVGLYNQAKRHHVPPGSVIEVSLR